MFFFDCGEEASDAFFCSAVRTFERAATAAALCEPWPARTGFVGVDLGEDVDLKAEDRAANAEALWVGPLWFVPLDLVGDYKIAMDY